MATNDNGHKSAKEIVKEYLDKRAAEDELFAKSYAKPQKNFDECWRYIVGEAWRRVESNCACLSDEEVFGLAVHYYDEDDIKVRYSGTVRATTSNRPKPAVKLTEKEKAAAKEEARRLYRDQCVAELTEKAKAIRKKPKPAPSDVRQTPSLFDGFDI